VLQPWGYRGNLDRESNFSTVALKNSCGKEGAVGAVEPGRTNREGGFFLFTSRQANNLNEYKVKKA